MTTKPKAKKFRIRRSTGYGNGSPEPRRLTPAASTDHESEPVAEEYAPPSRGDRPPVQGDQSFLTSREEIEQIKAENLTGRQLRMARRLAQKNGLTPSSDLDAVRLLRKRGIDPFKRNDMLELVVSDQVAERPPQLPATVRRAPPPSTHVIDENERARDVRTIQLDLARRRRKRLALLLVKLGFFVFLPTFLAGYYYYSIATPMYSTKSEFVIQQAEAATPGGLGGLFAGTGFATSQDSITVQSYLNSRDAMLRLDRDHGFKAHFQQPHIDSIQRLEATGSNEAAYRIYQKRVKIGYDPTEGIVKMEVVAASPAASQEFSQALISYAEEQVDNLTQRLRKDQMKGARDSYTDAETRMFEAQRRVLELQEQRGVLSADIEITSQMSQISTFEVELKNRRLELAELMDNPKPNRTKVDLSERAIGRLETLIADMRRAMTEGTGSSASLAKISGELVIAQADLQTRQLMLSQSLQQLESARIEANRQVRYLSLGVRPVPPDEASYPKAFENTMLAFLIFAGLYLMASLTASILREQVTA